MRVLEFQEKKVPVEVDTVCDRCKKSCIGGCGNFCGISFTISGGYDSPIFPDDETVRLYHFCEICADKWLSEWDIGYINKGESI